MRENGPIVRTEKQKNLIEKMDEVEKRYREARRESTLNLQITERAFRNLKGKPGMSGDGFSRLIQIIENGEETFHLIVSPYTNVQEIRKSQDPTKQELTLSVGGLSMLDDTEIGFELAIISSTGVAEIRDRSQVHLKDVIKIEMIPIETANKLIAKS